MPLTWWCVGDPQCGRKPCGWAVADPAVHPLPAVRHGLYACPKCGGLANRKTFPPDIAPEGEAAALAEGAAEYRRRAEREGQQRLFRGGGDDGDGE